MVTVPFFGKKHRPATPSEIFSSANAVVLRDTEQLLDIVTAMPEVLPATREARRQARNQAYQAKVRCERMLAALNEELRMFDNK